MRGLPAVFLNAVVDSHYVTSETLQAFEPVFSELLNISTIDFSRIVSFNKFKEVLKEENSRDHNIYN
jgi:hypothetical protein